MTTENEKIAAIKADAFELGMHALLKEAGCTSQAEAANFMKIAAQLAQYPTKEAALKALKALGGKVVETVKEHPGKALGGTAAVSGLAGTVAGGKLQKMEDEMKKKGKPPFGKKK